MEGFWSNDVHPDDASSSDLWYFLLQLKIIITFLKYRLEVEKRVFKQFESLSNVKREGDALVITFGSGEQQKFEPEARPEPASKHKINWMK